MAKKPKMSRKDKFKLIEQDPEALKKYRINFVKQQLRAASVWKWPAAGIALDQAKIDGMFKCADCKQMFGPKEINRDHKDPVEDIKTGFTTLDNYAERLLTTSGQIQILCESCHSLKTALENAQRVKNGQKPIRRNKKKKKR